MTTSIKNPWGDGRNCTVIDKDCEWRSCLMVGEHKGVFRQGRGYTQYFPKPWKLRCMENYLRGCPWPLPDVDPNKVRCCGTPDFPMPRSGSAPAWQKCCACGARRSGRALEMARNLRAME